MAGIYPLRTSPSMPAKLASLVASPAKLRTLTAISEHVAFHKTLIDNDAKSPEQCLRDTTARLTEPGSFLLRSSLKPNTLIISYRSLDQTENIEHLHIYIKNNGALVDEKLNRVYSNLEGLLNSYNQIFTTPCREKCKVPSGTATYMTTPEAEAFFSGTSFDTSMQNIKAQPFFHPEIDPLDADRMKKANRLLSENGDYFIRASNDANKFIFVFQKGLEKKQIKFTVLENGLLQCDSGATDCYISVDEILRRHSKTLTTPILYTPTPDCVPADETPIFTCPTPVDAAPRPTGWTGAAAASSSDILRVVTLSPEQIAALSGIPSCPEVTSEMSTAEILGNCFQLGITANQADCILTHFRSPGHFLVRPSITDPSYLTASYVNKNNVITHTRFSISDDGSIYSPEYTTCFPTMQEFLKSFLGDGITPRYIPAAMIKDSYKTETKIVGELSRSVYDIPLDSGEARHADDLNCISSMLNELTIPALKHFSSRLSYPSTSTCMRVSGLDEDIEKNILKLGIFAACVKQGGLTLSDISMILKNILNE